MHICFVRSKGMLLGCQPNRQSASRERHQLKIPIVKLVYMPEAGHKKSLPDNSIYGDFIVRYFIHSPKESSHTEPSGLLLEAWVLPRILLATLLMS